MKTEEILSAYNKQRSIKAVSRQFHLSEQVVRRILISCGVYWSERAENVTALFQRGKTVKEIAEELQISRTTVFCYIPYEKGSYVLGDKSNNAIRIQKWRQRKKAKP